MIDHLASIFFLCPPTVVHVVIWLVFMQVFSWSDVVSPTLWACWADGATALTPISDERHQMFDPLVPSPRNSEALRRKLV